MYTGIGDAAWFLIQPTNLMWLGIGTVLGLIAGTLPGISGVSMMALMLPFTFGMPTETSVLMLIGVYASATYSSSTGGILYNIPGGAAGIPATLEGYRMAQKGQLGTALSSDIYASFLGSIIGFFGCVILTPIFMSVASVFGTAERGLFALLALVLVGTGALSRADPLRGILSVGLGLLIGTVGMQPNTGFVRYVADYPQLWDGLHLVWVIVGLFAIPQIFRLATLEKYFAEVKAQNLHYDMIGETRDFFRFARKKVGLISRTGLIGTVVGALPGLGTVAASWLGYQEAYRSSKQKEEFGKGTLEGLVGAETANNAAVPTTLVPLLALGIPGSAASSLILGAFLLAGVQPGPRMMETNSTMVWAILLGLFLTGVFFVLFGLPFHRLAVYVTKIKPANLIPAIVAFSAIGTFLATGFEEGIYVTLAIGLVAVLAERLHLSISNILLGAILGPIIEQELTLAISIGGAGRFAQPAALTVVTIIGVALLWGLYRNLLPSIIELFRPLRGKRPVG
jgi:putative tricarboxylic transport membrane protein